MTTPSPPPTAAPPFRLSGDAWTLAVFGYLPSVGAAAAAIALFLVITLANTAATRRHARPQSRFLYFITATGVMEVIGYATRIAVLHVHRITLLIITSLFLILPPIALAVVNYSVVGKLMHASGRGMGRWMQPKHVVRLFLGSDLFCLCIQGAGGAQMVSTDPAAAQMGQRVILFGLAVQLAFFAAFTYVAARLRRDASFNLVRVRNIDAIYHVIYATIALLFLRNVYRVVEFAERSSQGSYISENEWLFYIFETLPILLVCAIYTRWHLGALLPNDEELEAAMRDGATAEAAAEAMLDGVRLVTTCEKSGGLAASSPPPADTKC
jgi:hypothetical protein